MKKKLILEWNSEDFVEEQNIKTILALPEIRAALGDFISRMRAIVKYGDPNYTPEEAAGVSRLREEFFSLMKENDVSLDFF